jgi:hypothetical protein
VEGMERHMPLDQLDNEELAQGRSGNMGDSVRKKAIFALAAHVLGSDGPGTSTVDEAQPAGPVGPMEQGSRRHVHSIHEDF